jgi:guanylate kinase
MNTATMPQNSHPKSTDRPTPAPPGRLIVVSGPSGSGKSTIVRRILDVPDLNLSLSVSATTRPPRAGESHGVEYYFLSKPDFERLIDQNELLEWAHVHDNLYGTPKQFVADRLNNQKNVILEIDVQGGAAVRNVFPNAALLFIAPPSMQELERRLRARSSESEQAVQKRLQGALHEIEHAQDYDHIIVNDDLDRAAAELLNLIRRLINQGDSSNA